MAVKGPIPPSDITTPPDVLTPARALVYAKEEEQKRAKAERDAMNRAKAENSSLEEIAKRELAKAKKKAMKEIQKRRSKANGITNRGAPEAGDEKTPFAKIEQQLSYKEEAVLVEILFVLITTIGKAIMGTHYLAQKSAYELALANGFAYDEKNPPKMYPLIDGKLDFKKPIDYQKKTPTRAEIRANGYVPPPDWHESYAQLQAEYVKDMMGPSHLSQQEKELIYAMDGDLDTKKKKKDQEGNAGINGMMKKKQP